MIGHILQRIDQCLRRSDRLQMCNTALTVDFNAVEQPQHGITEIARLQCFHTGTVSVQTVCKNPTEIDKGMGISRAAHGMRRTNGNNLRKLCRKQFRRRGNLLRKICQICGIRVGIFRLYGNMCVFRIFIDTQTARVQHPAVIRSQCRMFKIGCSCACIPIQRRTVGMDDKLRGIIFLL